MPEAVSISRSQELPRSMDIRFLFEQAIHHAQQFSGDIWTDYNAHDPGVTLLEYLCYAITDLGYRTNFPIEDLLYAKAPDQGGTSNNALYGAAEILPVAPLTINDYRKLIIDAEKQVNNVWVMPFRQTAYDGLYQIKLQVATHDESDPHHFQLINRVRQHLLAARNLGEDIAQISVLQHRDFALQGLITLRPDALAESVMANVLMELDNYLIPRIVYTNLQQLHAEGRKADQIFDGPHLKNGFIADEALLDLPGVIYVSEIRDLLLAIDGVQTVGELGAMIDGVAVTSDEIEIPENTYLILDRKMIMGQNLRQVRLFRNNSIVSVNYRQVYQIYQRLQARYHGQFQPGHGMPDDEVPFSKKKMADVAAYYSFQRYLPVVYGIGPYGLPRDADRHRRAQAHQLKGFLAIAELFMASYLSQLTQLRSFFSIEEGAEEAASYFHQFPFDIPDVNTIVYGETKNGEDLDINAKLAELTAFQDGAGERRNRFMDHLMARFGEEINQDVFDRLAVLRNWSAAEKGKQLLQAKTRYLRDMVALTGSRACGFNYLKPSWGVTGEQANVSGFERRLSHHLHFPKIGNFSISQIPDLPAFRWQSAGAFRESNEEQIKLSLRQLLAYGQEKDSYHVFPLPDGQFQLFFHTRKQDKPQLVTTTATKEEALAKCNELVQYLRVLEQTSLGCFVVEHILLRPQRKLGRKMEISIDEGDVSFEFQSIHYQSKEAVAQASNVFLINATKRGNIDLVEVYSGAQTQVVVVIKEEGYPVLISSKPIPGKVAELKPRIKALKELLKEKKKRGSASIDKWISFHTEPDFGQEVGSEFFSHRLSIVVPKWPKVFQSSTFRQLFDNQIAANLPAHLAARVVKLGVRQMQEFEGKYESWLEAKWQEDDLLETDRCAKDLIYLLGDEKVWESLALAERDPTYSQELQQELFNHLGFSYVLRGTEMQIIEGIGPKLSHLLRLNEIDTWKELAHANPSDIRNILTRSGLRLQLKKVDSWIEQAKFATAGKWPELIALQRELHASATSGGTSPAKLLTYVRNRFNLQLPE